MTETSIYRVGKLEGDDIPTSSDIQERIDGDSWRIREVVGDHDRRSIIDGDVEAEYYEERGNLHEHDEVGYCYFTYVTDTKSTYQTRDEQDDIVEENVETVATSSVLYFDTGKYIFESTDEIDDSWIPEFLLDKGEKGDKKEIDDNAWEHPILNQEFLREFYDNSDVISIIKFSNIGEEEGSNQMIAELGDKMNTLRFSSGQGKGNLANSDLIDEFIAQSEIDVVSGRGWEKVGGRGYTVKLRNSGRIEISWRSIEEESETSPIEVEFGAIKNETQHIVNNVL